MYAATAIVSVCKLCVCVCACMRVQRSHRCVDVCMAAICIILSHLAQIFSNFLVFKNSCAMNTVCQSWQPDIPDGRKCYKKTETIYQWRCPRGYFCGKNQKKLYQHKTFDAILKSGSTHLFDKSQHPHPEFSWYVVSLGRVYPPSKKSL